MSISFIYYKFWGWGKTSFFIAIVDYLIAWPQEEVWIVESLFETRVIDYL